MKPDKIKLNLAEARRKFVYLSESLADSLLKEAKRVKEDSTYRPNSLGIVQGEGLNIDRICIILKMLDDMENMA